MKTADKQIVHRLDLPAYTLPDSELPCGASLGNGRMWVNTKASGAIERIFNIELGECLINAITIRYAGTGNPIQPSWAEGAHKTSASAYIPFRRAPASVELHPAYQRRRFTVAGSLNIRETVFVPLADLREEIGDPPILYQIVELENSGDVPHEVRMTSFARLSGSLAPDVVAHFDPSLRALIAFNKSTPQAVRIFGMSLPPTAFATSFDFGSVYELSHMHALSNSTEPSGDVLGCLQLDTIIGPGKRFSFSLISGVFARGIDDAVSHYTGHPDADAALGLTIRYLQDVLQRALVMTPNTHINQGVLWSKVNMRRVMARYPQGAAFTNEPGVSSNVVGRDAVWFVYGNDHFLPDFSLALLEKFASVQYADGKIPEYYNAIDGRVEDDGLNINDDTPLFILAVNHHFRASGDLPWLRSMYPAVQRAARYIMSQRDDRGLVFCSARDPRGNVWAIASWRNVIPGYSINGAVTEINAECAAALRSAGHLADNLGDRQDDAREFTAAYEEVRAAMDRHLRNPDNGLYYLNIDVDGNIHTDVTGDEIFPVMLRVCDEDTGFRIISRLNSPDFWTVAGLRTASRSDLLYDPSGNVGLLGGVWPGLTWWYAFAAARYHPEFMERALSASFEHYARNPMIFNTVPGQFGEWFDGESLANRGMRLSPWEPPRFLWAAVEGVCGLMLTTDLPRIDPLVPPSWKWVGVRRLPYHGRELTYFAARSGERFHIYATGDVESDYEIHRYASDVSDAVAVFSDAAAVVALRRDGELLLLVGNVGTETSTVPLNLGRLIDANKKYEVRTYDSERASWEIVGRRNGGEISALAVNIEMHGFRLIELKEMA